MRIALLALVLAAAALVAWLFLAAPSAPPPATVGETGPAPAVAEEGSSAPGGGVRPSPVPAAGKGDVPPPHGPHDLPMHSPPPLLKPSPDAGEVVRENLSREDQEKVDAIRKALAMTDLGEVDWRTDGVRAAFDLVSKKSGVAFEIQGEGVGDLPTGYRGPGHNALEAVRSVTLMQGLKFEVLGDKVVVRR